MTELEKDMIHIKTNELYFIVNAEQIKTMYFDKKAERVEIIYLDNTKLECEEVWQVTINGAEL